jgi:hypothetical protein
VNLEALINRVNNFLAGEVNDKLKIILTKGFSQHVANRLRVNLETQMDKKASETLWFDHCFISVAYQWAVTAKGLIAERDRA